MSALDRPVRVQLMPHSDDLTEVRPSDVVAAHNAQTADQANRLVLWKDVPGLTSNLMRERDEARAERDLAVKMGDKLLDEARAEVERLREGLRNLLRGYTGAEHVAREALGEQP